MGKIQRRKMVKHTKKRGKFLFFSYPLLLDSPFRHRPRRQPGSRSPPITPGWAKSIFSSILGAILALRSQRGAQKVLPSPALLFLQIDLFVKTKRKFKERPIPRHLRRSYTWRPIDEGKEVSRFAIRSPAVGGDGAVPQGTKTKIRQ